MSLPALILIGIGSILSSILFIGICITCCPTWRKRERGFSVDDAFEVSGRQLDDGMFFTSSQLGANLTLTADNFSVDRIISMALFVPLRPRIRRAEVVVERETSPKDLIARARTNSISAYLADKPTNQCPILTREHITYHKSLQCGWFGKVYAGTFCDSSDPSTSRPIIVKAMDSAFNGDAVKQAQFLAEIMPYADTQESRHILKVTGVAKSVMPYMVAFELASVIETSDLCDMKSTCKRKLCSSETFFSSTELINMCIEMTDGLRALHSKGYVHHDLGLRSFLFSASGVKLGDFGCNEELYQNDYVTLSNGDLVSLRWMDPHTFGLPSTPSDRLTPYNFTIKGNIWSLGICFWELLTHCEQVPYSSHSESDLQLVIFKTQQELNNENSWKDSNLQFPSPVVNLDSNFPPQLLKVIEECWRPLSTRITVQNIIIGMKT